MFRNDRLRGRYSLQKTREVNSVARLNKTRRKNNSKRAYQLVKDLTSVKQGKSTAVQDLTGKCLTEEREISNRWTEYCSELYNHKASGDTSVLNCPQTHTDDDYPILGKEEEAAVQSLKKGKSAGVDNIPAELVQAGGEDVITALTTICNKDLADRRMANPLDPVTEHRTSQETCNSAGTTERSASAATQAKSY